MKLAPLLIVAPALAGFMASTAGAAAISAGNLVIYRVGTGAAALNATATAVFIDEYTPAGTLVQSIAAPATGAGSMTAVGNASTEGIISPSPDGTRLFFTGYRKDAGGTNPSTDTPATTNRVIGSIDLTGTLDTASALTDTTGTIRSAVAASATGPVYLGTSAGVRYAPTLASAMTSTVIDTRNSRQVYLAGSVLMASNGSTAITPKVQSYGSLPTGTTTPAAIVTLGSTDAVKGIWFADLSSTVAGIDTAYALSTVANQLLKFNFDGTVWNARGSVAAAGAANLTGVVNGANVDLYLTTATQLLALSDTSGFDATLTGTTSVLATAAANTAFRGIGVLVPEPSAAALGLLGVACLVRRRR